MQRGEPDRVGVRHPLSLCLGEGQAFFEGEGEPPAGCERPGYLSHQRRLVGKREHGLEQEHHVERARRDRGDPRDLEATGKVARPLTRDVEGARAEIHPQIGATQLLSDESSGSGNSAAQVEHGDPGRNAGLTRQGPNLCRAHEALLLDELAGSVRRHAGSPEGRHERRALVLLHGRAPFTGGRASVSRSVRASRVASLPAGCQPGGREGWAGRQRHEWV